MSDSSKKLPADGTVDSGMITDGTIVNADVNASAAIAHSKLADVSATDRLLGRSTAGAGAIEEITCTSAGRALLDDATAGDQRTTLGLGTIATQAANSVDIDGGAIDAVTIGTNSACTELVVDNLNLNGATIGYGATAAVTIDSSGAVNLPAQPSVVARNSTRRTDVTGDGTSYDCIFDTEIKDVNGDWDGTSTFTAPVTGTYLITCNIACEDVTTSHSRNSIDIITSNRTYRLCDMNNTANIDIGGSELMVWPGSAIVDMDASDTAKITINFSGSSKVVDLSADSNIFTYIGVQLLS